MGFQLGPLGDHHRIDVHHLPTPLRHQGHHLLQQLEAVGPLPLRIRRREVLADVSERQRTKQGIHHRMHQHIGIAVAIKAKPIGMLQGDPTEDQRSALHQPVDVITVADPHLHGRSCVITRHSPARIEIGATIPRALLPLLLAPGLDGGVVSAPQHRRHRHALELRRSGVVGMFQQQRAVAFLHQ